MQPGGRSAVASRGPNGVRRWWPLPVHCWRQHFLLVLADGTGHSLPPMGDSPAAHQGPPDATPVEERAAVRGHAGACKGVRSWIDVGRRVIHGVPRSPPSEPGFPMPTPCPKAVDLRPNCNSHATEFHSLVYKTELISYLWQMSLPHSLPGQLLGMPQSIPSPH
jgi:hypothetical protein